MPFAARCTSGGLQMRPAMLKVAAELWGWELKRGRDLAQQLPTRPADHGDAGGAHRLALGDQTAHC